tara:strand:+ start:583 stop:1131 length:549 start_codon:yes stop_codon:yes gene_type:complete
MLSRHTAPIAVIAVIAVIAFTMIVIINSASPDPVSAPTAVAEVATPVPLPTATATIEAPAPPPSPTAVTAPTEAPTAIPTAIPAELQANKRMMELTPEQWAAIQHFAPERQVAMARIGWCESRFNENAVGDGGDSIGAWQVQPRFWGPVPDTLEEQAKQAERIAAENGVGPWTTRDGCAGWR